MSQRTLCLLLAVLAGCETWNTPDGVGCDEIVASVMVDITDPDGNPLAPTDVTYQVDGGDPQPAECANDDCTSWVAGHEEAGEITVTAVFDFVEIPGEPYCWYDGETSATVTVDADECHVITENLTVIAEDVVCE